MLKVLESIKIPELNSNVCELNKISNFKYTYLLGIAMLFMMLPMISGLLIYKIIIIGSFIAPAGILTSPVVYCLNNVTTEVYGYPVGRNMMWWFIVSSFIFVLLLSTFIHFPSPDTFKHQGSYEYIFGSMPRVFIAGALGNICGLSVNSYVVSKLKIFMQGKKYWLRSMVSTFMGEIIYNVIAYPIMYIGKVPPQQILYMFISVSLFKVTMTFFLITPENWLANFLKRKEKINIYDYNVNFNIFKLGLTQPHQKPTLKLVKNY